MAVFVSPAVVHPQEDGEEHLIAFNFIDVEIPSVITFISEITGNNFIFDERIKGRVTIITPTKLTTEESFSLFTSVLSLKGFTIIPLGEKTYKVIQSSLAREAGKITEDEQLPVNEGYITKLVPIGHVKVEDSLQFLRPVVSRDGHISSFGPRNMLLIVDSAVNIEKIMTIIREIDNPPTHEEPAKINVYPLEYADAAELAEVLEGIMQNARKMKQTRRGVKKGSPQETAPPLFDSVAEISVTPDRATNSLIIVASPADYRNLVQVIRSLDKKRKQVYVEAMIIEARINKLQELGTQWRAAATHDGEPIVIGGFGTINTSSLLSLIGGLSGFSAGGMGNFMSIPLTSINADGTATVSNLTVPGFAALFSMQDFRDVINVLSTPQILTSDNEEAEITVGENVPFISARERDITTTNTVLSSIERKDVGIKLRITPQITEGDYVNLDLYQEISALQDAPETVLTTVGPTTTLRSTKTSVVVKDAQTVVIGGLMQETEQKCFQKMPLLGDLPGLGWLFKFRTTSKSKTNLLVFLTPYIVKESSQLSDITRDKKTSFSVREERYVKGELLVRFRDDVSGERAREIISRQGASVIKYMSTVHVFHIRLGSGQDVEEAIGEFSSIPEVLYAEPNFMFKTHDGPLLRNPSPDTPEKQTDPPDQLLFNNEVSYLFTQDVTRLGRLYGTD
jgi:general secretion pathway protein D